MNQNYQPQIWFAYLVELKKPLGGLKHKASYYLGITCDPIRRLNQHANGQGAKMLRAAAEKGIEMWITHVWQFQCYWDALYFEFYAKYKVKNHQRLMGRSWRHLGAVSMPLPARLHPTLF